MQGTMRFIFDTDVYNLGVRGNYFNVRQMENLPSTDSNVRAFVDAQLAAVPANLDSSKTILGFYDLHAAISKRPDKLVAAPTNLLQYFRAKQDIPRINGIVDVYNAVSVSTGLAIGAHDLAHVSGDIALRFTKGNEHFLPLGASKPVKVLAGEYSYIDSVNDILCRLEVRQVEKTKVTADSHDVFFIIQGHHQMEVPFIDATASTLACACKELFGGELEPLYPPKPT